MTRGEGVESLEPTDDEEGFLLPVIRGTEGEKREQGGGESCYTRHWYRLVLKQIVQYCFIVVCIS